MKLFSALLAIPIIVCLAACSSPLQRVVSAYGAITDASVPPQLVTVAANSFDAVEVTAKNVLVACTPANRPSACNDVSLRSLIAAIRAGRGARDALEAFLKAHPGQLGSKGLYDALETSITTITTAITTYNGAAS